MKRTNWESVSKSAKLIKKNIKIIQQAGEFLNNYPEAGFMRDNKNGNIVNIKEAKSSSLRRYVSLLNNFYYLVDEKNKERILEKKIEIEKELNTRDDGIIKK